MGDEENSPKLSESVLKAIFRDIGKIKRDIKKGDFQGAEKLAKEIEKLEEEDLQVIQKEMVLIPGQRLLLHIRRGAIVLYRYTEELDQELTRGDSFRRERLDLRKMKRLTEIEYIEERKVEREAGKGRPKKRNSIRLFPERTFPKGFIWPTTDFQDMTRIWNMKEDGRPLVGNNHWSVGRPLRGNYYSERFNPESPYYQSWTGTYSIDKAGWELEGGKPSLRKTVVLTLKDQIAWLREGYGCPHPETTVINVYKEEEVEICGHPARRFYLILESYSDVGDNIMHDYKGMVHFLSQFQLGRNMKYSKSLIPPAYMDDKAIAWLGGADMDKVNRIRELFKELGPYHPLRLYTIYTIWSCPQTKRTFCSFGSAAGPNNLMGKRNFREIVPQLRTITDHIKCH